jgi:hypothetical protein
MCKCQFKMSALQLYTQLQRDLRKYVSTTSTCLLEHIELSVLIPCVSNLIKTLTMSLTQVQPQTQKDVPEKNK